MSAHDIPVTGTFDPVTGVITFSTSIRPQAKSHQGLYQLVAADLRAGDPTATYTKTLGGSSGNENGDITLAVSLATL